MYRIALQVADIDLDDDQTNDLIAASLGDLSWVEIDGRVLAILHTACDNPVGSAVEVAHRIEHGLPRAKVLGVDEDLVSISDISRRIGASRETIRLWVAGKRGPGGFPAPSGSVGGGERGSTKVWSWATVNGWLGEHYRLADEDEHLTPQQVAEVNASVLRVHQPVDAEWQFFTSMSPSRLTPRTAVVPRRQRILSILAIDMSRYPSLPVSDLDHAW
jgi:hypothetical protein